MDEQLIKKLEDRLGRDVQVLNDSRGVFDRFKGVEYSLHILKDYGFQISVVYTNRSIEKKKGKRHIIANVSVHGQELDGFIYHDHKKAGEITERTIHGFIHQHNIPSGNLLYN